MGLYESWIEETALHHDFTALSRGKNVDIFGLRLIFSVIVRLLDWQRSIALQNRGA